MTKISEEEDFLMIASDMLSSNNSISREDPKIFPHKVKKSKE
jgi:hypothetical protein